MNTEGGYKRHSYSNIQALRALAASIVAFLHLQPMLSDNFGGSTRLHFGAFGVDIFFVISGFVMFLSNRRMDHAVAPFLVGRLFRIVPMYWAATLVLVVLFFGGLHPAGLYKLDPQMLAQSMVFVPSHFDGDRYDLILNIGWTLTYELMFYGMFALTFGLRSPEKSLAVISVMMFVLVGAGLAFPDASPRMKILSSPIMLEFLPGALLAIVVMRWDKSNTVLPNWAAWAATLAIICGACLVIYEDVLGLAEPHRNGIRAFVWGPPAFMVVAGAVVLDRIGRSASSSWILLLGSASYMLYLFHMIIMQAAVKVSARLLPHNALGAFAGAAIALAAACLAAIIIHLVAERRILRFGSTVVRAMQSSEFKRAA